MPTRSNVKTVTVTQDDALARLEEYLANDPTVCFVIVFGSYVNEKRKKAKDIDIAIYFYHVPQGLALLNLMNTCANLTRKEVDLIVLNTASAFLRHQVMKTGIPLVVKDRREYQRFREEVISDYDEYKFVSAMNRYDR